MLRRRYVTFGNYCDSVPSQIDVRIKNKSVNKVESCKYLGVIFDYNLKWNKHFKLIISKTRYLIHGVPESTLIGEVRAH